MNFKQFGLQSHEETNEVKVNMSSHSFPLGTYVTQVTATDADDPTYGNSARVVYSILHGQPYFSVDPKTGKVLIDVTRKLFCRCKVHKQLHIYFKYASQQ